MFLAVWGAVVSTVAIGWNVWRDLNDRAKLDVICYVGQLVDTLGLEDRRFRLAYRVANAGRRSTVLTHIGGSLRNGKHFMINTTDLPRTLQPGDFYLGYSNDLSVLDDKPTALWAIDSLNHYWKIPKKTLRALLEREPKA